MRKYIEDRLKVLHKRRLKLEERNDWVMTTELMEVRIRISELEAVLKFNHGKHETDFQKETTNPKRTSR